MCPSQVRKVGDRRQQLIDAARTLFSQRPYEQVTTSEIANKAGVAYGLIAHHFENKLGLYLTVMNDVASELAAIQTPPTEDSTLVDHVRHALHNHISYIDTYATSFVALARGQLGSDPDQQNAIDKLRWQGAQRILSVTGIVEPIPPALRTALRGWIAQLDEMMIDRIKNDDVEREMLVELAAASLITVLKAVQTLDPAIQFAPEVDEAFSEFRVKAVIPDATRDSSTG
jgi:AcrR family transcriptional regulator